MGQAITGSADVAVELYRCRLPDDIMDSPPICGGGHRVSRQQAPGLLYRGDQPGRAVGMISSGDRSRGLNILQEAVPGVGSTAEQHDGKMAVTVAHQVAGALGRPGAPGRFGQVRHRAMSLGAVHGSR